MEIFENKKSQNKINLEKSTVLLSIILLIQIYQVSNMTFLNLQLRKDPVMRLGEASEDFCFYTVKSLIEGNFSWMMFDEVTFKGLKAEPNYFDFKNDEKVKMVKVKGDQCRVLTEADGRLKGLLLTLNESTSNPLYYKAIQITEEDTPTEWTKR